MKKAYAYYRVSTEEQANEGKSIETQRKLCRKWAEDNDFKILREFIDEGKSATTLTGRASLQDLLEKSREEKLDILIVQDTDRLARNVFDHLTIKSLLKKQGVSVVSVSQPMIDDTAEGKLMDGVVASINEFQSAITGRKTSKVLLEKARLGWYPKIPPLGYRNDENPNPTSNLDKRIIVLDNKIAPYLKKVFEEYATGKTTIKEMAEYLNNHGVTPNRGTKVHKNTVCNILKNEFYTGYFTWQKTKFKGKHTPLIDTSLFERVQLIMQNHNKNASRKRKHNFLLSGFIYSKVNGRRMLGEHHDKKSGKKYSYYCDIDSRAGSYIGSAKLESEVENLFGKIQISKEYSNKVLEIARGILKESRKNQSAERKRISSELQRINRAMIEVEDSRFINRKIDNETFTRLYQRYSDERDRYTNELNSLNQDDSENIKILEKILGLAENIGNAYKKADDGTKRSYLNLFFKKIFIDKGKIVDFELTEEVGELIKNGSVQLRAGWGG